MTYIYGIHHWRILWSSYSKLAWVAFEPTNWILFRRSNGLSYQAMSSTRTRANFLQLPQFIICSVSGFISSIPLLSSVPTFTLVEIFLRYTLHMHIYIYIYIYISIQYIYISICIYIYTYIYVYIRDIYVYISEIYICIYYICSYSYLCTMKTKGSHKVKNLIKNTSFKLRNI